jgi:hypothetical protein
MPLTITQVAGHGIEGLGRLQFDSGGQADSKPQGHRHHIRSIRSPRSRRLFRGVW